MCTAVEETIIASILAVVNTSEPVVEIRPKKNSGPYPQTLLILCSHRSYILTDPKFLLILYSHWSLILCSY